jgi:hypothetical protein
MWKFGLRPRAILRKGIHKLDIRCSEAEIITEVSCSLQEEDDQPEPPKRTKQANQYFWRRHYLSIIQGTGFC